MSYYSIDAILADNQVLLPPKCADLQKVPCTFNLRVPAMVHLDSSSHHPENSTADVNTQKRND